MIAAILAVLLSAGCTSTPEKETSNQSEAVKVPITDQGQDRYVQINLLDDSYAGGKFVSETAAFTTIIVMYTYDRNAEYPYFNKGNGAEVAFKNSLIDTMITIDEPTAMIEAKLQEISATDAARKKAAEEKAEAYRIAKEKREDKQTKPTN